MNIVFKALSITVISVLVLILMRRSTIEAEAIKLQVLVLISVITSFLIMAYFATSLIASQISRRSYKKLR
jgi:hypothetical protein